MPGKRVASIECINGCGALSTTVYEGVEIDICPICAGVWLDTGELTTIIETRERTWPEKVVRKVLASSGEVTISRDEKARDVRCPRCDAELPPSNYQGNSGIIVNTCEEGHGIWLDAGELAKIQIYMEQWDKVFRDEPAGHDKSATGGSASGAINGFLSRLARAFG